MLLGADQHVEVVLLFFAVLFREFGGQSYSLLLLHLLMLARILQLRNFLLVATLEFTERTGQVFSLFTDIVVLGLQLPERALKFSELLHID